MNIPELIKIAQKLDSRNKFKTADKLTSYISKYADLVEQMIDEAIDNAKSSTYTLDDPALSIMKPDF